MGVRYQPGRFQEAKTALATVMEKHFHGDPYGVMLLRDVVNNQYWQDEVTSRILMSGTVLAIILALLGLMALMGFVAHQKRKEIGVRRVMGAQIGTIVYDLNRYVLIRFCRCPDRDCFQLFRHVPLVAKFCLYYFFKLVDFCGGFAVDICHRTIDIIVSKYSFGYGESGRCTEIRVINF